MTLGQWNINGFSKHNIETANIREAIIQAVNLDIICINETFLRDDQEISIQGYKWIGHNRTQINPRAMRGSGGVGILVKESVLETHEIFIIEKVHEDIIWVKIQEKEDPTNYMYICSCYLSPEGSTRVNRVQEFYDQLLSTIYILLD